MTKGVKLCLISVVIIFLAAVIAVVFMYRPQKGQTVEIIRNNEVLYTFDLGNTEDITLKIDSEDGGYNVIEIKDGAIRISEADCFDKTCVRTGTLKSANIPIVCLPHRLVIRFAEGEE